jgi:hypothetical protein
MKWIPFLLILIFTSIHCSSQINCCSHLSKEEIIDLKAALQKAAAQEDNPYFLALYKEIYPDSVVKTYQYKIENVDSFSFDKSIQDQLKQVGGDELWFYVRNKKGSYKIIASCNFNNYGRLYFPLSYETKILNKIKKETTLHTGCILSVDYLSSWFVYKDGQLFILKGNHLKDANAYFKRKYSLDQFKKILRPIIGHTNNY